MTSAHGWAARCAGIFPFTVFIILFTGVEPIQARDNSPSMRFRKVAETGMHAPGTENGVVFGALTTGLNHSLLVPRIDEAGRVAFMATLLGPGIDVTNFQGIWSEQNGELKLVARGAMLAPGVGGGALFRGVPSLELPFAPEFGNGQAAFHAELVGGNVDVFSDEGLWVGKPGDLRLVAREGSPVPGLPGVSFSNPFGFVNALGDVFMQINLLGPGVDNSNQRAIFTDRSGQLELFLREGDAAPFTEAGTVFGGNLSFRALTLNANSNFAISAKVEGPSVNSSNDELLYVERDGAMELVLREGDAAPGAGQNVTFGGGSSDLSLAFVEMNANDRVAFLIRLGGAVSTRTAIFSDHTGVLTAVAVPEQPAPSANFNYTLFATSMLNDNDEIAFGVAFPHDGGVFTPAPFGVFSDVGGAIAPAVSPGDVTLEGEIIEDARLMGFNNAGQMLLSIRIDTATFRSGLWLRDTDGALHRIGASGDQFDISGDGTDVRELVRVVTGGFNEAGQAALRFDFTDDSSIHSVAALSSGIPGDADGDGDVDLNDFDLLADCTNGPNALVDSACQIADMDSDSDVDLADYSAFQREFSGP